MGGDFINIETVPFDSISLRDSVSYMRCGNIIEIMYNQYPNADNHIIKLSSDSYVCKVDLIKNGGVLSDDIIKKFVHHDSKSSNFAYMRSICNNFRNMINANLTKPQNALFITVTYRQRDNYDDEPIPMTDTKRLMNDLHNFIHSVKRRYNGIRYLTACEPQKSGSWHAHIILIFPYKAPFLPSDDVAKWWGQGFVKIEKIADADNLGAYYVSYLTDMEMPDDSKYNGDMLKTVDVDGQKKKILKGMRLCFYPPYMHPFRWSRNCEKPVILKMKYSEALSLVKDCEPTFEIQRVLSDGEYRNVIKRQYFNTKRKGDS